MSEASSSPFRVLIAGGGVAGLETVLALRDLLDRAAVTVVTPEAEFVYRPMAVGMPFGRGHARRHRLADIADQLGARLIVDRLQQVDGAARTAVTANDERLSYDALVVAVGAASEPAFERVMTWTPEADSEIYGGLLADFEEGYSKRLAFVIPDDVYWPLPAYELALMTAWDLDGMGQQDVDIVVYTHEHAPLEIFGPRGSAALVADLDEANVRVQTDAHVTVSEAGHLVADPGGHDLRGQRVVALPRAIGRPIDGLPTDERGFVLTDRFGSVPGTDAVWAAGDAAAFPIKQGGLAAQQADVVARAIAARAGADVEPEPFRPVMRGVLLTGRGRAWMRHDVAAGTAADTADRHALFWPPTKIAGRYLSPFLASLDEAQKVGGDAQPSGELVDIDLESRVRDA
ncbi:MAG: FAD-dependent oxidoreductase [Solirubrobacteraceae bacterium]